MKTKFKSDYKFIANGRLFKTYDEVVDYANSLDLRIANTEKFRGRTLITLNK